VAGLAARWEAALHSLADAPHVIDVRTLGLVAGIELEARPGRPGTRAFDAFTDAFFNQDVLIRTTGDTIALSPPLIISEAQIDELAGRVRRAIERTA
jgi:beta-alanine--pyruvate transaminase